MKIKFDTVFLTLMVISFVYFVFLPVYRNLFEPEVEYYFEMAADGKEIDCIELSNYLGPAKSYSSNVFLVHEFEKETGKELSQCKKEVESLVNAHCSFYLNHADKIVDLHTISFHPGPDQNTIFYCQDVMQNAVKKYLRGVVINNNTIELADYGLVLKKDSISRVSAVHMDYYMSHWLFVITADGDDFKVRFGELDQLKEWRKQLIAFLDEGVTI